MKPAHLSGTAGQIDNSKELDKMAFRPKKLGDIIDRIQRQEAQTQFQKKKLTFEEWFLDYYPQGIQAEGLDESSLEQCWKAAQENVPSQAPGTGV